MGSLLFYRTEVEAGVENDAAAIGPPAAGAECRIEENATATVIELYCGARQFEASLGPGESLRHKVKGGRMAWLQIMAGCAEVNDETLSAGDAATFGSGAVVKLRACDEAVLVLFDLPEA